MSTKTYSRETAQGRPLVRAEAQLVLVLRADDPMAPSIRVRLADLAEVSLGRGTSTRAVVEANGAARRARFELASASVSARHARLVRNGDAWSIEDAGSKNGTYVDGSRLSGREFLGDGSLVEIGPCCFLFRETRCVDNREVVADADLASPTPELATFHGPLAAQLAALPDVAQSDIAVLILGDTGTGKEVAARAVHALSGRDGKLVPVHLAAYPDALLAAELFGYRKGAYTGATDDRLGLVRAADRGTLLLDELGDLPPQAQVALLRVLQNREVHPFGYNSPVAVQVRFIGATHRSLDALVAEGHFREDLLARLGGWVLRLPPLAARREDLGLLIRAIVRGLPSPAPTFSFTAGVARALLQHDWPLNVRELERALTTALVLAKGRPIDIDDLPERVRAGRAAASSAGARRAGAAFDSNDAAAVLALLRDHNGNVMAAARAIGRAPNQVYRWIERHGIDVAQLRGGGETRGPKKR